MYFALKNIHMLSIVLSAILLSIRYALMMANSPMIEKKFLKISPHVIDTILILSGIGLIFSLGFIPFTPGNEWFTEKVTCILAYFALGFFTLKVAKNRLLRTFAFFGALGWLVMAGKIAITKVPALIG
ncbi:SirB2 family protein [Vibrio sp. VB16]|uniref:SirB2 family protein n=1 Tax=Vibrio sp. VB16 TaxID=2785746 RepID=UPI00189FBED8|nr:SirB2 family protein [Vibrio sp. VB16]UGA54106.1 SirB2 family protein [Vibrio sp. VB16]